MANATATTPSSIDPREAAHFGAMAADWWDPAGSSAMLHRLNPVRLKFLRETIDRHWQFDECALKPLAGRTALDVGCGAGLLCEPLARLGASVTGVDAAGENIDAARAHAAGTGLTIDYMAGSVDLVANRRFDLVTSFEVIEHVVDPRGFVRELAGVLADDGLLLLSTPNRTALSRFALINIGETIGRIPRGTHDWDRFLTPPELTTIVEQEGLKVIDTRGLGFSPFKGFHLTDDLSLDYFVAAVRG